MSKSTGAIERQAIQHRIRENKQNRPLPDRLAAKLQVACGISRALADSLALSLVWETCDHIADAETLSEHLQRSIAHRYDITAADGRSWQQNYEIASQDAFKSARTAIMAAVEVSA